MAPSSSTGGDSTTATSTSTPASSTSTRGGGPARFVQSGPATSDAVALTFHTNGDPLVCARLFEEAKAMGVPITLFLVGTWLEGHTDLVRQLSADGHELANHTYTHPSLGTLGAPAVLGEIERCRAALMSVTGAPGRWFRPSGIDVPTETILREAGAAGYDTVVGYDIDPLDYQDPGVAAVEDRVRVRLHPGAIVSLHTGHEGTVSAFGDIVRSVRSAGLRLTTVSGLLG